MLGRGLRGRRTRPKQLQRLLHLVEEERVALALEPGEVLVELGGFRGVDRQFQVHSSSSSQRSRASLIRSAGGRSGRVAGALPGGAGNGSAPGGDSSGRGQGG